MSRRRDCGSIWSLKYRVSTVSKKPRELQSEKQFARGFFLGVGNNKQELTLDVVASSLRLCVSGLRFFDVVIITNLSVFIKVQKERSTYNTSMKLRIPRRIKNEEPVEDSSDDDDSQPAAAKKPEAASNSPSQAKEKVTGAKSTAATSTALTVS